MFGKSTPAILYMPMDEAQLYFNAEGIAHSIEVLSSTIPMRWARCGPAIEEGGAAPDHHQRLAPAQRHLLFPPCRWGAQRHVHDP